jgi:thiol-disulfide isomerase/thioredoxin
MKKIKKWSLKKIIKETVTTLLMVFVVSMVLNYIRKPDTSNQLANIKAMDIYQHEIDFVESDKKNSPTIIHFWATWCPTCKLEAPNIEALKNSCNVITIAVNSGTDEEIKSFMSERNLSYRVINDSDGLLAKKFGVEVFPTTFIYDANDTLRFSEVGYSTTVGLKARVALIRE